MFEYPEPHCLTPTEKNVANVAWDIAKDRNNKEVTLSEVVERLSDNYKNSDARRIVNQHMKAICLKSEFHALRNPRTGVVFLHKQNAIGRGNVAVFNWRFGR
jgi:hypothetical protein